MAANRRSTWRLLAALLLLVTVPAAGSIPALPPPAPKADLVSADLLDDVAGPERPEILVLVAFVVPEETVAEGYPHRKTRVWGSNLGGDTQPIGESWFKGEIAVGVLVVRFYHADGLGSVRVLTDEAGTVTDRYSFTAFGELLEHVGDDPNAYLFAGEPLDPNAGFYYNRARWMDPAVGRFVSVDPFEGWEHEPATLHKYLYCAGGPAACTDPTGRFSMGEIGTVLATVGTVYSFAEPLFNAYVDLVSGMSLAETSFRLVRDAATGVLLSALAGGLFKFAPRILRVRPTGWRVPSTGRPTRSFWRFGIAARGEAAEDAVLAALGRNRKLPWNYPVIDDFTDNIAMSIKSLDLTTASESYIRRQIRDAARKLDRFVPRNWGDARLKGEVVSGRTLVFVFERNAADRAQARVLNQLADEFRRTFPDIRLQYQWVE